MPKHFSNIVPLEQDEDIISSIPVYDFNDDYNIIIATKDGMIKKSSLSLFKSGRYNKTITCIKLKDGDRVVDAIIDNKPNVLLVTNKGYELSYSTSEISNIGLKASGVKAMTLKGDYVVSINNYSIEADEYLSIITDKGTGKRIRLSEIPLQTRARRGLQIIRDVKNNPYQIINTFIVDVRNKIGLKSDKIEEVKISDLVITDRYSTGTSISKKKIIDSFVVKELETKDSINTTEIVEEEFVPNKEQISLEEIDSKLMTIDDFLK